MIYVTGDTHGDWMHRLNMKNFPEQRDMTKDDLVIILGDFGIWDDSREERHNLDWLDSRSFTTAFVDGNHSNFDLLATFPEEEWNGGRIHEIRPSVFHLMRGQVFTLEGKTFFTFGGASSHDIRDGILDPADFPGREAFKRKYRQMRDEYKMFRVKGISWWEQELPTPEEMEEGLRNLDEHGNEVDFILSHSPDSLSLRQMDRFPYIYRTDILSDYLLEIKQNNTYGRHLFGHMHENKWFYETNSGCLYEQIIQIL